MGTLTIRKLDERTKSRLRIRAAEHGRSMEEEAREILRRELSRKAEPATNFAEMIRRRFEPLGGLDLQFPQREPIRDPPDFE